MVKRALGVFFAAAVVRRVAGGFEEEQKKYAKTLTYEFMSISQDYPDAQCVENSLCKMPRDGFVRFGHESTRYSSFVYSVLLPRGTVFGCTREFFQEDPFVGKDKWCEISTAAKDPTPYPTRSTPNPTLAPSPRPTKYPTLNPTSGAPSKSPTTLFPTGSPSTLEPSREPSGAPTTQSPSASPSQSPTTLTPSQSPTMDVWRFCLSLNNTDSCSANALCEWNDAAGRCLAFAEAAVTKSPSTGGVLGQDAGAQGEGENLPSWVSIVATNIGILGIVLGLSALGFIYVHRNKPVIQLSQTLFLELICVGIILVNASIMFYAFTAESPAMCVARKWWFDLTFCFTISIMLVKVWRVWRVFSVPVKSSVQINNAYLLKRAAVILALDVVLLAIWTSVDNVEIAVSQQEGVYMCKYAGSTAGHALYIMSYVYLFLLVVACTVLACRVKDLGSVLGESKQLYWITNNILVFAAFNGVLSSSDFVSQTIQIMAFALSILICSVITLVVLLLAKYERFEMTRDEILFAAMEKKRSSQSGGRGSSFGPAMDSATMTNNSSKTGFLDNQEVLNVSGNVAAATIGVDLLLQQQRQKTSRMLSGRGAQTAQAPPIPQSDLLLTQSARSLTENAMPVQMGSFHLSEEHAPQDAANSSFQFSPRSPPSPPPPRSSSDLGALTYQIGEYAAFSTPTDNRKVKSERFLYDEPDSDDTTISGSGNGAGGGSATDHDEYGNDRAAAARLSNETQAIVDAGFKIGQKGCFEEYVHRESGDTFWLNVKTGDISHSAPGADVAIV